MKKKILSFILAIFMILPCSFLLTACGENEQITKEEWNSALAWKEKTNVHIYSEELNPHGTYNYGDVKYDGTNVHCKQWDSENPETSLVETYFVKEGNTYSRLDRGAKGDYDYAEGFTKENYDAVFTSAYSHMLGGLTFDDFKYNKSEKLYVSKDGLITVAFTFNKKTITKISVKKTVNHTGDDQSKFNITITFEDVTVTVPEKLS